MDRIFYRIKDDKGNYVSVYSFSKIPQGRGKKPIWYYFSETGHVMGVTFYPSEDSVKGLFDYLVKMNQKLNAGKSFKVVPVDRKNVVYDGKVVSEVL